MGATYIQELVSKIGHEIGSCATIEADTPRDAYTQLHRRDGAAYGCGGYTGSWAEVPGVVAAPSGALNRAEALRYADSRIDGNHVVKWENGEYVPVYGVAGSRTVTVEVDEEHRKMYNAHLRDLECDARINALAGLKPGEYVAKITAGQPVEKRKVSVTATKGTTEARYFVIDADRPSFPERNNGYASQAEARAAMAVILKSYRANPSVLSMSTETKESHLEVVAMTRRVTGEALVVGTNTVAESKTKLTFTVERFMLTGSKSHRQVCGAHHPYTRQTSTDTAL